MRQDIDFILRGWEFKAGEAQARLILADDGRQVIQCRVDLGLLQMEVAGRPDGTRPLGCSTYLEALRRLSAAHAKEDTTFILSPEQCQEADREFGQFFHRRLCWLALHDYQRAIADSDHTLAFMDFVREHSPSQDFTQAHEQYRGFVLFHRTQAAASLAASLNNPEGAIDAIASGLSHLREYFVEHGVEDQMEELDMVQKLRQTVDRIRQSHGIEATLKEQLDNAVANEEYEAAAKIRDALRSRQGC